MIKYQFQLIDDPDVCKTIRLEDMSLDSTRELFDFLQLDGFDAQEITGLMNDTSPDVRHSHAKPGCCYVTDDELKDIVRICAPLAAEFGYHL